MTRASQHTPPPADGAPLKKSRRPKLSITVRNLLMVLVGAIACFVCGFLVFYRTIMYGDPVENFGIVLMLTVPVIVGVAFRVVLDAILDAK